MERMENTLCLYQEMSLVTCQLRNWMLKGVAHGISLGWVWMGEDLLGFGIELDLARRVGLELNLESPPTGLVLFVCPS